MSVGVGHDVVILATGGTIEKIYDTMEEKTVFQCERDPLSEMFLAIGFNKFRYKRVLKVDSLDMSTANRHQIAEAIQKESNSRILITHGTSTIRNTAEHIEEMHSAFSEKTIVLTGSMYPYDLGKLETIFNFSFALSAASTLEPGVYISMHSLAQPVDKITKTSDGVFKLVDN